MDLDLKAICAKFNPPCLLPRQKRTLWTEPYMVRPALVAAKFGNGKRLICLSPIMHRPSYYLVWVDDRWELSNWGKPPILSEHLDDIWQQIAEEFGERGERQSYRWPEEDSRDGCDWWAADARDVLPKRRLRAMGG